MAASRYLSIDATAVRPLPGGDYWIGDDATATSAPRHLRRFAASAWIESGYTPWDAFAEFVTAGGFTDPRLWRNAAGEPFPAGSAPVSVDRRCEAIREATLAGMVGGGQGGGATSDVPVLGLTWFEASAVCQFFGGRLPFEVEWEAAMVARAVPQPRDVAGRFQEWTGDAYFSRYWRTDGSIRGRPWAAGREVVVRGHAVGEPALALTARRAAEPGTPVSARAFRRIWDHDPRGDTPASHA